MRYFVFVTVAALVVGTTTGCDGGGSSADPVSPPTGLEATSQDGAVELMWQDGGAAGYNVYRDTVSTSDVSGAPINESPVDQPSFVDESVENGVRYFYRVTAVEDGQESEPSSEVSVRPFPGPPTRP